MLTFLAPAGGVCAVGEMEVPVIRSAQIRAHVSVDAGGRYVYAYAVSNAAGNRGDLWEIKIDVSADRSSNAMAARAEGFTLPMGRNQILFSSLRARFAALPGPQGPDVVPFGQVVPSGWNGGFGRDGRASFSARDEAHGIKPGASLAGLQLQSYGVPTVRKAQLVPFWMHIVKDHDAVTPEQMREAAKVERDIVFHTATLGPSPVAYGSREHWDQLRDDLARAMELRWIVDRELGGDLLGRLAAARSAVEARDLAGARNALEGLLAAAGQAAPAQLAAEASGLITLSTRALLGNLKINPPAQAKATRPSEAEPSAPSARPDLVVQYFIPPMLMTAGGRTFYVSEATQNVGSAAAPPTVTRYFISTQQNFDARSARTVGERRLPALQPEEASGVRQLEFTMPSDLPQGTYYLAACADADNAVAEADERNNCSGSGR